MSSRGVRALIAHRRRIKVASAVGAAVPGRVPTTAGSTMVGVVMVAMDM
jgi:hypothetical protein